MADKPPPYRGGYEPPDPPVVVRDGGTFSSVTNRVFEAYKINPIMVAMIVLLLTILGALGYYMMRNDDRIYGYIALRDKRESDLWDRLVEMARQCRDKEVDKSSSYPEPQFPNLSTGGPAFKQRENKR